MIEPITRVFIGNVSVLCGMTCLDAHWLSSYTLKLYKIKGDDGLKQITSIPLSLIFRFLEKHPEACPIPKMANIQDLQSSLIALRGEKFTNQQLGIILGCSKSSGEHWLSGIHGMSQNTQRLLNMIDARLIKEGANGFEQFCQIVNNEALSRGIKGGIKEVMKDGWYTINQNNKLNDPQYPRIKQIDFQNAQEILGCTLQDLSWLTGILNLPTRLKNNEIREKPIKDPTLSLLLRMLMDYPEDNPLPKMPTFDEISNALSKVMRDDFVIKRIAPMLGRSPYSSYTWQKGEEEMSGAVQRLAYIWLTVIEKHGHKGYNWIKETIEEEAESRGIAGGLDTLWTIGWRPRVGKLRKPPAKRGRKSKTNKDN